MCVSIFEATLLSAFMLKPLTVFAYLQPGFRLPSATLLFLRLFLLGSQLLVCSCSLRGDLLSTRKLSCHLEAFRASTMGLKMEKVKKKKFLIFW